MGCTRREWLLALVAAGTASCAKRERPREVVAAKAGEVPVGESKMFRFGTTLSLLVHTAPQRYRAMAATCTHGRCSVRYRHEQRILFCPCHDGAFDLDGRVLSGPPPSPLETFQVELRGSEVIVSRAASR